jgi:hypothetical protein
MTSQPKKFYRNLVLPNSFATNLGTIVLLVSITSALKQEKSLKSVLLFVLFFRKSFLLTSPFFSSGLRLVG